MHQNLLRRNYESEKKYVLVEIVSLIIEGRLLNTEATSTQNDQNIQREKTKKFVDGPHIAMYSKSLNPSNLHVCDLNNLSCQKYKDVEKRLLWLCELQIPMCIEVLITSDESDDEFCPLTSTPVQNLNQKTVFLFERWNISFRERIGDDKKRKCMATIELLNAIRSQMYFSKLSAWLLSSDDEISNFFKNKKLKYRISLPGETYNPLNFTMPSDVHSFPALPINDKSELLVVLSSLNRSNEFKTFQKVFEDTVNSDNKSCSTIVIRNNSAFHTNLMPGPSTLARIFFNYQDDENNDASVSNQNDNDESLFESGTLETAESSDEDEQEIVISTNKKESAVVQATGVIKVSHHLARLGRICRKIQFTCDSSNVSSVISFGNSNILNAKSNSSNSNAVEWMKRALARNLEKSVFQTSLETASDMIYGHKSGLMFIDRSSQLFLKSEDSQFDISIDNKNFSAKNEEMKQNESSEEYQSKENETENSASDETFQQSSAKKLISFRLRRPQSLLGSYEESVLNGRLSPVSIVNGYRTDILISSRRRSYTTSLPVTVFFYTLSDSFIRDSSFLGHINMTKNELAVPKKGTLCCTLMNPMGTVVKMFVIMYDLSDMPPNSRTFLRQKTFKIPSNFKGHESELKRKWLRYLIHLKFMSSKSGQIYLHSDIRLVVFQKAHLDAAIDLCSTTSYEYRSFISGPNNPKYSFRF